MFVFNKNIAEKEAGNGITRKVLSYSETLMVCELHLEKGAIVEAHVHPHEQSTYIVSGRCYFTIGDEANEVSVGDSVLMPSDVPHKVEALENSVVIDVFTPARSNFI